MGRIYFDNKNEYAIFASSNIKDMRKIVKTEKRYTIHFINSSGFCYRSRGNCPYGYVKEQRKIAKALGEKIEVEYERTIKEIYG
jgi:hypothetical protein